MIPKDLPRTLITRSLGVGGKREPEITNEQFLYSFLEHGCWLRSVAAQSHFKTLQRPDAQPIERLAAITSFYQLLGQAIEDALTNLIAWSIWAEDKNQNLLSIIARLSLRFGMPNKPAREDVFIATKKKISESMKQVDILPREYLRVLLTNSDRNLPRSIGIEWKRDPSVKLVPAKMRKFWDNLPQYIRGVIEPLVDDRGALLASCYNKVKHGPQLVVSKPIDAVSARGIAMNYADKALHERDDTLSVRLLMNGARTQETKEEVGKGTRVSPYLDDDPANIKELFYFQLVSNAVVLFTLGTWIFNSTYTDRKRAHTLPNAFVTKMGHDHLDALGAPYSYSKL